MKLLAVVLSIGLVLGFSQFVEAQIFNPCKVGNVRGFAHVRGDPRIGIGSLDSVFTSQQDQFAMRYNCRGIPVQARRIDEGLYEVRFPNNPARVAGVTAVNAQGASGSAYFNGDGRFVVSVRGPIVENNVLQPRELPFYIIVF